MSVSVLFCEGAAGSADARVLRKLLAGRCEVRPFGGKYGFGAAIRVHRQSLPGVSVAGLLDGDFPVSWQPPQGAPQVWKASDQEILGWRWERNEIENYLLDPEVVSRALPTTFPLAAYTTALADACARLCDYQAARAALSACRPHFEPLASNWGRKRGRAKYPFPDAFDESACRAGLRQVVQEHNDAQTTSAAAAVGRFEALLPEFRPGGCRYQHFLHAFAGKDLLLAMDGTMVVLGHRDCWAFCERVLVGIEQYPGDISQWLPEWQQLQSLVDT